MYKSFFDAIRQGIIYRNQRSFWHRNSYAYRMYRDAQDRQSLSNTYARQLHMAYFGANSDSEEWRVAQANIRRIKEVGTQMNAAVALVVFPLLAQLDTHYPFKDICDLLVNFGAENDIPTHNLLPAFIGQNAATLWVAPNNQHPNPRGHQIAANSLLPFVRRLLSAK
jgi:hypothetical protein